MYSPFFARFIFSTSHSCYIFVVVVVIFLGGEVLLILIQPIRRKFPSSQHLKWVTTTQSLMPVQTYRHPTKEPLCFLQCLAQRPSCSETSNSLSGACFVFIGNLVQEIDMAYLNLPLCLCLGLHCLVFVEESFCI